MATLLAIMVRNSKNSGAKKPEAHKVILPPTNVKLVKFPDYILCGQLNLHRSAVNAAALSKYIAKQWDFLRINRDGVISSHQLEINRDPDSYGGRRDGKPLTVSEWTKLQKDKLLTKRKEQADLENKPAEAATPNGGTVNQAGTSSRGARRGRGGSRGRSSSRGRGSSRGSNRGSSRGRGGSYGRGQRSSRGSSRGSNRGSSNGSTSRGGPVFRGRNKNSNGSTNQDNDIQSSTSAKGRKTDRIKPPRLARRNLRDMGGNLPRPRGPDKPPETKQPDKPPDVPMELEGQIPDLPPSQPPEVTDELVSDAQYPEPSQALTNKISLIEQLDGNLSLSDSDTDPETPVRKTNLYEYDINSSLYIHVYIVHKSL